MSIMTVELNTYRKSGKIYEDPNFRESILCREEITRLFRKQGNNIRATVSRYPTKGSKEFALWKIGTGWKWYDKEYRIWHPLYYMASYLISNFLEENNVPFETRTKVTIYMKIETIKPAK